MKTKLYILDEYTNGHEAAMHFFGDEINEYEIVFAGSHQNVFSEMNNVPGVAVVPILNSIAGEVREVLDEVEKLQQIKQKIAQ